MAISFVGGQTQSAIGRTTDFTINFALTGGSDSLPQEGDLVVCFYAIGSRDGRFPTPAVTGYTAGSVLSVTGPIFTSSLIYAYKFMGSTPDTSFTLSQTFNLSDASTAVFLVFRGVDPTTPLDVTPTTMTGTGTTSGEDLPNPAAITPTTAGAWVVVGGSQAATTTAAFTQPATGLDASAFYSVNRADSVDSATGAGFYSGWTSGSHDVDIFGGGNSNANNGQVAYTLALRPAGGGGGTSLLKVWNGSAWGEKPIKWWNGSAWVTKPVKSWNGSAWV